MFQPTLIFNSEYKYGYPDEVWFDKKDFPGEEWRDAEEGKKFQVSNFGRVRSLFRMVRNQFGEFRRIRTIILRPYFDNKNYPFVNLNFSKKDHRRFRVHRLVARSFLTSSGVINRKMQVHHKNGIKKDNRVENLEILDSFGHGKKDAELGLKKCNPEKIGIFQRQRQASMSWLQKKAPFRGKMKTYFFISPTGEIYKVVGLHAFCFEFGFDRGAMLRLTKGLNCIHKGWRAISLINNHVPDIVRDYSNV